MGDYRAASFGPEWECHVQDERGSSTGEIQLTCSQICLQQIRRMEEVIWVKLSILFEPKQMKNYPMEVFCQMKWVEGINQHQDMYQAHYVLQNLAIVVLLSLANHLLMCASDKIPVGHGDERALDDG